MKSHNTLHGTNRRNENLVGYLFMLPTLIGFSVFVVYPLIVSVYYALTKWNGITTPQFVGLRNYRYMFTTDPSFWKSITSTLLYVLATVPTGLILGLFLAVLLNKSLPGIKVMRTIYYLPVVLPSVASLALWKFIYNPDYGMLNMLLKEFHLPTSHWLQSPTMALPSIAIYTLWTVGGTMIILLGGLQTVPKDLYEAADVDGASGWTKFYKITVPMITPVLFLQLITGFIGAFQQFNASQILTQGGPSFATYFLSYAIYDNALNSRHFGYAMAEVWVLFAITVVCSILVFRFSNSFVYYENDDN